MSEFWNERYGPDHYYYGKEPNGFFKSCIDSSQEGTILLPGDGEGRNAVYAATQGWHVFAFDPSSEGKKKALRLADEKGTHIHYDVSGLDDYKLEENSFDMIALIYVHLYPGERMQHHIRLLTALKPGGRLVMEVFSKKQLGNNSGGPKELDLLYDINDLKTDFQSMKIIKAEDLSIFHDESFAHQGQAEVIRFIGEKRD
jgi:SAM-dependent methyltransferase